MIQFQMVSI